MNLQEAQINALEMLAKNEELLNELYNVYAEKFPDFKEFWLEIAENELEHAGWIRKLYPKIKEGSLFLKKDRLNKEAIQIYSKYVKDEISSALKEKVPLTKALSMALGVEKALIEKEFFEVFDTDSLSLKQVLLNLAFDTKKHIEKIEKAWAENR